MHAAIPRPPQERAQSAHRLRLCVPASTVAEHTGDERLQASAGQFGDRAAGEPNAGRAQVAAVGRQGLSREAAKVDRDGPRPGDFPHWCAVHRLFLGRRARTPYVPRRLRA